MSEMYPNNHDELMDELAYDDGPDPEVDNQVVMRCVNAECDNFAEDGADAARSGSWWHPRVEPEYQGVPPHGGTVWFEVDDARECPECGSEGEEV